MPNSMSGVVVTAVMGKPGEACQHLVGERGRPPSEMPSVVIEQMQFDVVLPGIPREQVVPAGGLGALNLVPAG